MASIRNIGFIILLSCLFISCDKNHSEPVNIKVVTKDFYSSEIISAYKVELVRRKKNSILSPDFSLDTLISDSLGKISHSFEYETGYYYKLVPINNLHHSGFEEIILKNNTINNFEILVKEFNILRINLANTNGNYKNILITGNSEQDIYYDVPFIDTMISFKKTIPDEIQLLNFKLYDENMWKNYKMVDTALFISKIDTFDFQFNY